MGSNDEFGPDTETIRAWLNKRASYAKDARVIGAPRGSGHAPDVSTPASSTVASTAAEPATAPVAAPAKPVAATPVVPSAPPVDSTATGRSVVDALRGPATPAPAPSSSGGSAVDSTFTGRSVVDALREPDRSSDNAGDKARDKAGKTKAKAPGRESRPPKIKPARPVAPAASDRPDLVADTATRDAVARVVEAPRIEAPRRPAPPVRVAVPPEVKQSRWTEPEQNLPVGTDVAFSSRGTVRKVLSIMLLASLAATATAGYLAYDDQTTEKLGIAGIAAFLTMVIWAIRAGSTTTKMSIQRGKLLLERGGQTDVIDLASNFTPIAMIGEPGQRRWTVLIERVEQPLVVINSSMVDPEWFTNALYRLRPELRPPATAAVEEYAEAG